jgi:hypothetical protein
VKFASASFEAENETHKPPDFRLFLTRVFLFDFFSIGLLRVAELLAFAIAYICLLRWGGHPVASAAAALMLTEIGLILLCVAIKKSLVGEWGADHSAPFWSWRHFAYFFAQDCFFVWCRRTLGFCAGTVLSNFILRWMGCRIGRRTIVTRPMQCSDWNAVSFGNDCVVDGFLQFHSFENMTLKVKRTHLQDGCTVAFGATVMGGAVIARATLAAVAGAQGDEPVHGRLRGEPRGANERRKPPFPDRPATARRWFSCRAPGDGTGRSESGGLIRSGQHRNSVISPATSGWPLRHAK